MKRLAAIQHPGDQASPAGMRVESLLDDVQRNVDGAKAVGMEACLFTTAAKAREDLRALGVSLP
ncbi:MAG: hypothetical protein HRT64_14815 [Erythrobacter sp.]|nr:hypothetical protein [Erythrobacter sp.]